MLTLRCGRCFMTAMVPDSPQETVPCLACSSPLVIVDPRSRAFQFAQDVQPGWKQPWGVGLKVTGIVIFVLSFIYGGNHDPNPNRQFGRHEFDYTEAWMTAGLNPLGWIALVLGIVWSRGFLESNEFIRGKLDAERKIAAKKRQKLKAQSVVRQFPPPTPHEMNVEDRDRSADLPKGQGVPASPQLDEASDQDLEEMERQLAPPAAEESAIRPEGQSRGASAEIHESRNSGVRVVVLVVILAVLLVIFVITRVSDRYR